MNCSQCGQPFGPDAKFCFTCGAPRPAPLAPRFQQAHDQYCVLRGQLDAGRITRVAFETALKDIGIQDAEGHYWLLGADSGEWYMHDGQQWVRGAPPAEPDAPVPPLVAPVSLAPPPLAPVAVSAPPPPP
ncbi:MAG: zinc ribbon domain-containing protein, partial [Anaerolineae bacterium]